MHYKKLTGCFLMMLVFLLVVGCSEDESPTKPANSEPTTQPPAWDVDTIKVPQKMAESQDPKAQLAVCYITLANTISGYGLYILPPSTDEEFPGTSSQDGLFWTYTWTVEDLTITEKIWETEDKYVWHLIFNGTDGEFTYENWKFIHAEATKDGKSGHMIVYEHGTTEVEVQWTWNTDAQGVYTFVMTSDDDRIEITVNLDYSGKLEFFEEVDDNYVLSLKVEWQSDGTGQWWVYEDGKITSTESWS